MPMIVGPECDLPDGFVMTSLCRSKAREAEIDLAMNRFRPSQFAGDRRIEKASEHGSGLFNDVFGRFILTLVDRVRQKVGPRFGFAKVHSFEHRVDDLPQRCRHIDVDFFVLDLG